MSIILNSKNWMNSTRCTCNECLYTSEQSNLFGFNLGFSTGVLGSILRLSACKQPYIIIHVLNKLQNFAQLVLWFTDKSHWISILNSLLKNTNLISFYKHLCIFNITLTFFMVNSLLLLNLSNLHTTEFEARP